MRILITGGTGLIGRALVRKLSAAGHQTLISSRKPDRGGELQESVEVVTWDGRSSAQLAPLLEGVDAVVHLAGEGVASGRWTKTRKQRIRDSRVYSTAALVKAFETVKSPPGVLVQGSAVGFYGPGGDQKLDESSSAGDDFLARVCRQWEAAGAPVARLGVRRALARTGVVLAREGGALPRITIPFRLFGGGPVGGGRQWMPWIHIKDEVGALCFLLENDKASGAFNLSAPQPVTNREFSRALGRVLRRPGFVPTPGLALRFAMGEMSTIVLDGQRATPARLTKLGYEFEFHQIEPALADLFSRN